MEKLRNYLSHFEVLTSEQFDLIAQRASRVQLKKGEYFFKEGSIFRKAGFITEGIVRVSQFTEKDEVTSYFLKENQFAASLESLNDNLPAVRNLQAATNTRLIVIGYEDLQRLTECIPPFARIVHRIIEHTLRMKLDHRNPLVVEDAKTRYERFAQEHADILQRVPLGHVASYLGITQQSLSRLRRELIRK